MKRKEPDRAGQGKKTEAVGKEHMRENGRDTEEERWEYGDLLYLPHHISVRHPPMSVADRAAQFSPFAALTGYDAAVQETARLTQERVELDESQKEMINEKIQRLLEQLRKKAHPIWKITYFQPDQWKEGGCYRTVAGKVKKIGGIGTELVMEDGVRISVEEIFGMEEE